MIKALACDIDGTITDEKRRLDLEAVRLLRDIEALGVPVVLATGNVLSITEAASTYIGTTGPVIAENGGIVKERERPPYYFCNAAEGEIESAFDHLQQTLDVRLVSRSDLRVTEIAIYRDYAVDTIREVLKGYNVRVVDTRFAIHLTDPNVNKGVALSYVADRMGLSERDFASIGDSENDLEMLERSGFSVAVGNASQFPNADFITKASYGRGGIEGLKTIINMIC